MMVNIIPNEVKLILIFSNEEKKKCDSTVKLELLFTNTSPHGTCKNNSKVPRTLTQDWTKEFRYDERKE